MIPSSISATLSADLTYSPNVHVQTVEIDRTGTNLIQQAIDNYVKWFITKQNFLALCSLKAGGADTTDRFTLGAAGGLLLTDASDAILKFSNIDKPFTIPTTEPIIQYGDVVTDASYIGQVGAMDVSYDRLLFKEDHTTPAAASATTTTWSFDQTSITLTANWSVNDSSMIAVSANSGVALAVSKAYNDAAADFIQIKLDDPFDPHGMTTSSADDVTDSVDYASKFQTLTTGEIQSVVSYPTVTVTDDAFTQACQQAINRDAISRNIYTDEQLRYALDVAIEASWIKGIQSTTPVTLQLPVTMASVMQENMTKSLTPLVVFDPASLNDAYHFPTLTSIDGETINTGYSGKHLRSRRPNVVDLNFTKHAAAASAFYSTNPAEQISSVQYSQDGTGATKINVPLTDVTHVDNDTFRLHMIVPTNDALTNGVTFYVTTRAPDLSNGDPSLNTVETQSFVASDVESGITAGDVVYPPSSPAGTVTMNSDYQHTYTFPRSMNLSEWTIQGTYTETYINGSGQSTNETKTSTVSLVDSGTVNVTFPVNQNSSGGYALTSLSSSETFTRGDQVLSNPNSVSMSMDTLPVWIPPTSVSLTQQSSLPGSTMLVVNKTVQLMFTTNSPLHSNTVSGMIASITQSVNGAAAVDLNLASSNVVIDKDAGTVTFDATSSSAVSHTYTLTLKKTAGNGGSALPALPAQTVAAADIYTFPTSGTTTKDIAVITVGETLTMTTSFSRALEADLSPTVQITDLSGGSATLTATKSGSDLLYAFAVANDSNHSGVITLAYGGVSETYQWASAGHLTDADIYTFPNLMAYDGTGNGYESGMHLKENEPSSLVLAFTGGDHLHSDLYTPQVASVTYKTGASGSLVTVPQSDVSINSATGAESITLANVVATATDNVYFYASLKAPDGTVGASIDVTVPSSAVQSMVVYGTPNASVSRYIFMDGTSHPSSWGAHVMGGHIRYHSGTLMWDMGDAATEKGIIIGRQHGASQLKPMWLIWREKTQAKSFSNLYYWQHHSSSWYMQVVYALWGINSITTDEMPSAAGGWTLIGYFRMGSTQDNDVPNLSAGAYVAPQFDASFNKINDGTTTTPLSTDPFGIWGITPENIGIPGHNYGHGVFISRPSVNESAATSLNDPVTTVLSGTLTYS